MSKHGKVWESIGNNEKVWGGMTTWKVWELIRKIGIVWEKVLKVEKVW